MNSALSNCSAQQLRNAAELKERIEGLQRELDDLLGNPSDESVASAGYRPRRRFSAATIARMRASQRARWAAVRGESGAQRGRRGRRKMSEAAKARLSLVAKARWKKARAAGRNQL